MRPTRRRGIAILTAMTILFTFATAPASAITLQRTWYAKIGSSGSNGTITLKAYTNGVGSIRYSLKGLRAYATYGVQIRYGTCTSLGSVAARPASVQTSATAQWRARTTCTRGS